MFNGYGTFGTPLYVQASSVQAVFIILGKLRPVHIPLSRIHAGNCQIEMPDGVQL